MKLSFKWLKDYLDFNVSPEEIAEKLTMAGIEVDSIIYPDSGLDKVIVGLITSIEEHPDADRLVVCQIKVSEQETLQIVTGAPNVYEGQKVPVAVVGCKLPNGLKIKKANLRGVPSAGMMCSAEELNLDKTVIAAEEEGILILPEDTPVGKPLAEVLGLDDIVLELELTPNRADCLSMINLAREISALTGGVLHLPEIELREAKEKTAELAAVEIRDEELCGRYVARIIKNVSIAPSPAWLRQRLQAAGIRSINNIVDITNFVMLEMGQPLHAFDFSLLAGKKIIVRRARRGESMITLDGAERQLEENMLVIADAQKPIAVAGVMGGENSEVLADTCDILLESAYFNGTSIRHTARKLGLRSEASSRFERGVNIDGALLAANRAAQLMADLAGGEVLADAIDVYPGYQEPLELKLRIKRVNQLLGTALSQEEISEYLHRLHFDVAIQGEELLVGIPSYRGDITAEIDLVEEVARIYGYGKIPVTLPSGRSTMQKKSDYQLLEAFIKKHLSGSGLTEVIGYSFISPKDLERLRLNSSHPWRNVAPIANPLSEEQSIMRTALLPNLLHTAAKNFSRRIKDLAVFELGAVFHQVQEEKLPQEMQKLGILISGRVQRGWQWPEEELDFFYLKGILESLSDKMGFAMQFKPLTSEPFLHPGRSALIINNSSEIGFVGELHPGVAANFGLEQKVYVAQLALEALLPLWRRIPQYRALPRHPEVQRDIALVLPEQVRAAEVAEVIALSGGKLLRGFKLFDVYRGKQIPAGYKSLAYSLTFQAADKTLTDQEVQELYDKIKLTLQQKFGAVLR